jgi:ferredoxin
MFSATAVVHISVEDPDGGPALARCRAPQTVLGALACAGRKLITVGCENGGCGVCRIHILDGTWVVTRPMSRAHVSEEDEASGIVLACRVRPTSDIRIRILGKRGQGESPWR